MIADLHIVTRSTEWRGLDEPTICNSSPIFNLTESQEKNKDKGHAIEGQMRITFITKYKD